MLNTKETETMLMNAINFKESRQADTYINIKNSEEFTDRKTKTGKNFKSDEKRAAIAKKLKAKYIGIYNQKIVIKMANNLFTMSQSTFNNKYSQIKGLSKRNSTAENFLTNILFMNGVSFLREVSISDSDLFLKNVFTKEEKTLLEKANRAIVDFAIIVKDEVFLIALNGTMHCKKYDAIWNELCKKQILNKMNYHYIPLDTCNFTDDEASRNALFDVLYSYIPELEYNEEELTNRTKELAFETAVKNFCEAYKDCPEGIVKKLLAKETLEVLN